jgi:photosystem I subunit 3
MQAESTMAEPAMAEPVEQSASMEAPQASFSWAPVAALIALPTVIAAFLLRKSEGKAADLESPLMGVKMASAGLAASAAMASSAMMPMPANATEAILGLTPCAESAKFAKNLAKEVKALERREKLYEAGSEPFLALEATKARTEARFAKYAASGLLCGNDGLPHLISDPGFAVKYGHAGETLIPTIGFLYIAGYIGTAGRTYLQQVSTRQKPTQSEIIIDVPLALSIASKSWDWPGKAIQELATGTLTEKDENVPVSRR